MKKRHDINRRLSALARQIVVWGKRQESDAEFAGGIHRPITMTERHSWDAYHYLYSHPVKMWIRATVYCIDDSGAAYQQSIEAETKQAAHANDLAPFRMQMLKDARDSVNPRHIVGEGFEMGVL